MESVAKDRPFLINGNHPQEDKNMRKIGDQTSFLFMEPINTYITTNEVIQREDSKDMYKYISKKERGSV